ncbi:ribonuclease H-like domain-containing protein [Tanacetum coccineum]
MKLVASFGTSLDSLLPTEAARTMLADLLLPTTFWAEAVSTACYIFNRHKPIISYIRPFGCHVTILDTLSVLGKFDGKCDEGFLVGYSLNSKAFRESNIGPPAMLIERKYPLSAEVCKAMLDKKLQGGKPDEDCYKLLKMMEKQAGIRKHKDWLVQEQTTLGKDFSNLLMADNLPKIVWLSTHHICRPWTCTFLVAKGLATPELMANCDDEALNHEDALDTGAAPKQQQQVIPQTTAISNIKLSILKKEEYDIWAMEMEHYLEYIDNDVWKVIQNGNSKKRISTEKDGVIRILPPVTAAEIQAVEKERKAKNILLMAILNEHMRRFHGMDDAKEIWHFMPLFS